MNSLCTGFLPSSAFHFHAYAHANGNERYLEIVFMVPFNCSTHINFHLQLNTVFTAGLWYRKRVFKRVTYITGTEQVTTINHSLPWNTKIDSIERRQQETQTVNNKNKHKTEPKATPSSIALALVFFKGQRN